MNVIDAIKERRAYRSLEEVKITEEIIKEIENKNGGFSLPFYYFLNKLFKIIL